MTQFIGILAFVVALLVSVMLHEAGHAVTARTFGMKVSRFFVGFGPTVWSFRRGETEYGVKALPLGGFAKIEGMTELEDIERERSQERELAGVGARGAGGDRVLGRLEGESEDGGLLPGEEDRAFFRKPAPQRAVVLAAGSIVHFVIAIVLVFGVLLAIGTQRPGKDVVGSVSACVPASVTGGCTAGDAASPAQRAGLQAGDHVVSIDGTPVTSWDQFTQAVRDHGAGTVTLVVRRGDRTLTLHPDLVAVRRDKKTGLAGNDVVGAIGLSQGYETVTYGPASAAGQTFKTLGNGVTGMYDVLVHRIGDLGNLFSNHRDPNGLVGVVGAGRVSGDILSQQGVSWADRVGSFVLLIAGLNLAVGIFNLLPLLPLDGGHLAILGFEQGRQGIRRVFGYRGPVRKVDLVKLMPATYAVAAVLIVVTVLVLSADIINPIKLQ